jgi:hypothetical protein
MAAAGTLSRFSELQGLSLQEIPTALKMIEKQNPARHAEIYQAVAATDRLWQNAQQARSAEQQIQQARVQLWAKGESQKFDEALKNEPREVYDNVTRNAARVLKESFGIAPEQLSQMIQTNPALRSAESQKLIYAAVKAQLNQEALATKKVIPQAPPVQRPGVSRPAQSYDSAEAASALRAFNKNPDDPKAAAAYVMARRAARK